MSYTYAEVAKMIDHSLLNPTLGTNELEQGCQLARAYDVASVCIMPYYLKRCAEILVGQHRPSEHDHRLPARRPHDQDQSGRSVAGACRRRRRT
jgi:hypothetical protein